MGSLGSFGSWQLDKFHNDYLQPSEEFLKKARRAIHSICEFLKATCFQDRPRRDIKVLKVVKGGSLGKGTSMKNGSDADLVLFLNIFKSFTDQENNRKVIIQEIERRLDECQELLNLEVFFEKSKWSNPRVLQFELYSKESQDSIEFDVLPAYDALEEQGGSLGKGTSMKNGSDADLVLFLNTFESFTDQENNRMEIIQEIERRLDECQELLNLEVFFKKSKWSNPRVLQFELYSKESQDSIEFDVLPAYDALGQYNGSRPHPQTYVDLIRTGKSSEFSSCFTELQKDFIVDRPTKLKSLIRLVKQWYKEVEEKSFPPKYALELLTVYAWEQGSGQEQFDTAKGFRTVLWLIENYTQIRIYWTKYYNFDNEIIKRYLQDQLSKNRPVILDPADPTANFGEAKGWDRLAGKAKFYASMNCCQKRDGSLVEPWNVPGFLLWEGGGWNRGPRSIPTLLACLHRTTSAGRRLLQPSLFQPLLGPPSAASSTTLFPAIEQRLNCLGSPLLRLAMDSLGHVESWQLDKFHADHLQPNKVFLKRAGEEIDRICDFLKRRCFQEVPWSGIKVVKVVKLVFSAINPRNPPIQIEQLNSGEVMRRIIPWARKTLNVKGPGEKYIISGKVFLGGSLGKGTSMKNGTADLELFLNISRSYTDQEKDRKKIIEEIERWLKIGRLSGAVQMLFLELIQIYKDQEKERKMFTEEAARRVDEWQKQPYLSDADLDLFSNIFKSYADQENNWKKFTGAIGRKLNGWFFSHTDWALLLDLIKSYTDKEKDRKTIMEETKRRVDNRQMKPYLSDADLVFFLNIFKSYPDQEKDRKGIIEEIERRLDEWQKEPYKLDVDVGFLLDLLESYRDQEKDPKEITQRITMWLHECKKELYLSDADLVPVHNFLERYLEQEKDRKTIIKEIAKWRKEGRQEPYLSNTDLGFLLDLLKRYAEKEEEQKIILKEMKRWFNECKENTCLEIIFEKSKRSNPRVLQFKLRSKKSVDFIEFDVLPAYDALGQYDGSRPHPQIYADLIRTGKSGEFSSCFTELQKDFIVDRPTKLKNLIRLVKQWYKEVQEKPFPPKYALELLTVYAWEQGSGQEQFDTAEGFRTVLWLIENYTQIHIYWTKYYDFDNEIIKRYLQAQLSKNRPVILDPADPTANFGEAKGWDRLAGKAKFYASMNCCQKRDGSLVEPWNVPLAKEVPWGEGWSYCTLL
ncbi:2'-5'-oligoadenylate synthase 3-like [Ahaetulla prasina]|uniref:2'-5'-oligoadenylate synthase 3-like n=1 Tax=Ahaetulla prasina TaxID=499056 RepID=UPI002647DD1D|nr:2'-5'-oligoadenylate synthase 3-like [Ahaetulla prasina]